jgi:hypothetical protein
MLRFKVKVLRRPDADAPDETVTTDYTEDYENSVQALFEAQEMFPDHVKVDVEVVKPKDKNNGNAA